MAENRAPRSVYGVGDEPDPRFSLANERTALAWMRTALALVAGGIAIVSLSRLQAMPRWSALLGAAACLGGAAVAVRAVTAWARVERALREGRPLPAPRAIGLVAAGVVLFALLVVVLSVLALLRP